MSLRTPDAEPAVLRDYLGRVRSHLPVGAAPEILRELESSILDRVDAAADAAGRSPDEAILREVLAKVGEPESVAESYLPRRHVVAPEHHGWFLVCTAITFAVHLALIGIATAMSRPLQVGPVAVAPIGPLGLPSHAAALVHALLVDVGLNVVAFALFPRARRMIPRLAASFRVDAAPRSAGTRALLAALVGVLLVFFRDALFVVVDAGESYPLFTPWFGMVLPVVAALLAFAVVVDVLYLTLGERRTTVALDAVHGSATLACMLHLARGEPLLEVPPEPAFLSFRDPVNGFLGDLGTLVLLTIATLAAVKTVRRLVRFSQL